MSDFDNPTSEPDATTESTEEANTANPQNPEQWPREVGGVRGPEPTRYGDWERNGRCSDF